MRLSTLTALKRRRSLGWKRLVVAILWPSSISTEPNAVRAPRETSPQRKSAPQSEAGDQRRRSRGERDGRVRDTRPCHLEKAHVRKPCRTDLQRVARMGATITESAFAKTPWTCKTKELFSHDERYVGKSSTASRVSVTCTTGAAWERTYEREIRKRRRGGGYGGGGGGRRRDHRLLA